MSAHVENRYAIHPHDFKQYNTNQIDEAFRIGDLMIPGELRMAYLHYDRFIVGGAIPTRTSLSLDTIDQLKAEFFLERREMGVINTGGPGRIEVDGVHYSINKKEALYVARGSQRVIFSSEDAANPAVFYLNSAPAHRVCQTMKIGQKESIVVEAGDHPSCNARSIIKLIDSSIVDICQLQMGITDLKPGNVWNTMPCHVHDRRMEVYFYFDVPTGQVVCHFLGQPDETRHIWMQNHQAVISPPWSIHCGSGTSAYSFIWGMAGENLDYTDMDFCKPVDLK